MTTVSSNSNISRYEDINVFVINSVKEQRDRLARLAPAISESDVADERNKINAISNDDRLMESIKIYALVSAYNERMMIVFTNNYLRMRQAHVQKVAHAIEHLPDFDDIPVSDDDLDDISDQVSDDDIDDIPDLVSDDDS